MTVDDIMRCLVPKVYGQKCVILVKTNIFSRSSGRDYCRERDNDAGGISTYSVVGAHFGIKMLWVLFLIFHWQSRRKWVRIGLVTRQGLGGVIRENFGVRWTTFAMVTMLIANLAQ